MQIMGLKTGDKGGDLGGGGSIQTSCGSDDEMSSKPLSLRAASDFAVSSAPTLLACKMRRIWGSDGWDFDLTLLACSKLGG